jgi:hypothetical protein
MADIRESFPTLEQASGEGAALRAMQQGDSPLAKNGAIGFAFRDSAGNVVLPQLNPDGTLPVSSGASGTNLHEYDTHAGSTVTVDVTTVTLSTSTVYAEIFANMSCFKETIFEVWRKDGATEVLIDSALVGPGSYTYKISLENYTWTSGASGMQKLIVRGKNLNVATTMRASLSVTQI